MMQPLLTLLLLFGGAADAASRPRVVIRGTTVGPGFVRISGKRGYPGTLGIFGTLESSHC